MDWLSGGIPRMIAGQMREAIDRKRRSVHFVPGANERMLTKSLELAADSLVLDLEDAVTPERKEGARKVVAEWLRDVDFGGRERTVRINPLDTPWGLGDLEETMDSPPDSYMIPKVSTLGQLEELDQRLDALERAGGHPPGAVSLIVLATETPAGALNIATFGQCERIAAFSWGAEDLSAALGSKRNRFPDGRYLPVFEHCRNMTLLAASAAHRPAIDTVFVDIKDPEGLRRECTEAAWMGFSGKITIHPSQIEIVNQAFTPSSAEVDEARELLAAFEENQAAGKMAFTFRGQMVDVPHLERAKRVLRVAGPEHDSSL